MKQYRTIMNGAFVGYYDMRTIKAMESEAQKYAMRIMEDENPDHVIYAYYNYNAEGEIETAYINILPKSDAELEEIASLSNYRICALHRHA